MVGLGCLLYTYCSEATCEPAGMMKGGGRAVKAVSTEMIRVEASSMIEDGQ